MAAPPRQIQRHHVVHSSLVRRRAQLHSQLYLRSAARPASSVPAHEPRGDVHSSSAAWPLLPHSMQPRAATECRQNARCSEHRSLQAQSSTCPRQVRHQSTQEQLAGAAAQEHAQRQQQAGRRRRLHAISMWIPSGLRTPKRARAPTGPSKVT